MIKRFKQLSKGNQRLNIVASIIFAITLHGISDPNDFLNLRDMKFWLGFIFFQITYWIIIRIILWIIDGYKN